MQTAFLIAAGIGGALILCQFLAGLFGLGADHDVGLDHDHDLGVDADHEHHPSTTDWFFGFLTFRALAAGIALFGLSGLSAGYYGLPESAQLAAAAGGGIITIYFVATIMRFLYRLKSDGTVRITHAVGEIGTVYLRIPASKSGPGKVTLKIQNRTVELEAYTAGEELATGSPIRVSRVLGPSSVEVERHHNEG